MYIKQVIIQGFRSYRDQTVIEPFSPSHNVVVGRNGSGKSNFFLAIQFVLSDEFSHMRQEERQQLLHEGTGPRVVSAYVEIIFDNSDNRIPIDKEEVSLRRVIGSKKDQYFLDKKNVTKTDVMNLLESAGFSRSNPYYIVKQGRIMQLATAKDNERLKLLREVAGTRVYDERKEESRGILKDSESKIEKINETLKHIEERLATLETEKEELKEYQKWDKERRCLEYTIHDKELRDTREKLEELEDTRNMGTEKAKEMHQEAEEAADKIEGIIHETKDVNDRLSTINSDKRQLEKEKQEQIKRRTKLELDIKDLQEVAAEDASSKDKSRKDLEQLQKTIEQKQSELGKILPEFHQQKTTQEELQARLKTCEQRRTDLFAKQGRGTQFRTKEERDKWIKKEMTSLSRSLSNKERQITNLRDEVVQTQERIAQIDQEMKERTDNLEGRKSQMEKANREYLELKKKRDELNNIRKERWRERDNMERTLHNTREELNRAERNLKGTVSRAVTNGIESVKKVVQDKGIDGVYGPLIENFTCDDKFFTAVEVTGGNKLFNIIVDSDKTGSQILSIMNKQKLPGEVTFMPLNRLHFRDLNYPQSPDVIPMIQKVEFDPQFKPAMQLAFAKTLICRDMEIATQFARSADMDCITLEGDQVSRKGALTGGFIDTRKSRLESQKNIWTLRTKVEEQERELNEINRVIENDDAGITRVLGEVEKTATKRDQLKNTYDRQKQDVHHLNNEKQSLLKALGPKERTMATRDAELNQIRNSLKSLNDEMGTELLSQLSLMDQQEVEKLNDEIMTMQEKLKEVFSRRAELEGQKEGLENLLNNNLLRRERELQQNMEDVSIEDRKQQLESKSDELQQCQKELDNTTKQVKDLDKEVNQLKKKLKELNTSLEEWRATEREKRESLQEDSRRMEKMANKRSLLTKKKEDCMKKIRELGSLPADAFEKFQKTAVKQLWKKLNKCNDELKKYSHVNKKALDQFVSFSEQKEKLMKRKDELDAAQESIEDLMEVLEQRKHEAILFTFKQVSHNFSDIFKQLVPGGKATLIMKKETDPSQEEDTQSSSQGSQTRSESMSLGSQRSSMRPIDEFTGISIKTSFTGKNAETLEMNQLSGGQKTLVALTLIFAIQKCDPAPFYLFDEIDQALDPQYRSAVADMIHKLAEKAQFITTTFRPELLESADKFYGVQFKNKVSHVLSISKELAKDFVEDDMAEK